MAADQERAARILALKEDHPELTWQLIADHVGVSMRAAQRWAETGAIAYPNAKKLAELVGQTPDYIMRGTGHAPDLMDVLQAPSGSPSQLAEIHQELAAIREKIDALLEFAEERAITDATRDAPPQASGTGADVGDTPATGAN